MLTLIRRDHGTGPVQDRLVLPFDLRQRSRLRGTTVAGRDVAVLLERGTVLRGGDRLASATGEIVLIEAAAEPIAVATSADPFLLARVAFHLGNRHVPLEIGAGWLGFEQDHVLEAMVTGLGAVIERRRAPFEPEAGAYGGGHHHHHDGHHHDHHDHPHDHD